MTGVLRIGYRCLIFEVRKDRLPSSFARRKNANIYKVTQSRGNKEEYTSSLFTVTSYFKIWGFSSAGRAPALQAGGQRFDPANLHQYGPIAQLVRAHD